MSSPEEQVQVTLDGRLVTMPRSLADVANQKVKLKIDGKEVEVPRVSLSYDPAGKPVPRLTTIYDAALKADVKVPILCHREYMTPVAVCRVCAVHVGYDNGYEEGRLAPACYRPVDQGMVVSTHRTSPRVKDSIKTVTELLLADHPRPCKKQQETHDCELETLGAELGVPAPRFAPRPQPRPLDDSSLVIAVDHNACILCDRCIRGCDEIRHNEVIGRQGKGYGAGIAFDLNDPMGESTCVACGECMVSCPTGALTNRSSVEIKLPSAEKLTADELAQLPLFEGVSHAFLQWNAGAVVRRHYKAGDIICREGEFGSTAFYIEKGKVEVTIQAPLSHVKDLNRPENSRKGPLGLAVRIASALRSRYQDTRDEEGKARYIHIDAPVALRYDRPDEKPVATLGPGDLFGEMTCMSFYPRSATVRALEDCTMLEMLRNVLYILQRNKKSRAQLEEMYRERAISSHLRSVPLFAEALADEAELNRFVDFLRPRVQLLRLNPGDVIFRQGDPADNFYLVRIGFVKVSQARRGGEHVLTYVGPGGSFGEIGLMAHVPEVRAMTAPGVRTATCSALDHVDLVQIRGEDFLALLEQFPRLKERLVKIAVDNLRANERLRAEVENQPLGEFLQQGLMNAQSLLVLDLERCTRCDECTKACSDTHQGVTRLIREGLRFDKYLVASSCRSCLDPYCMVGCPVGSIRRRDSREIIIEDWCIGCGKCAENCPYGNINMHGFQEKRPDPNHPGRTVAVVQQKATLCDLCSGLDGQPSCVYACPHDAAFRMSGPQLRERIEDERS
ncbi:MAG TPA: cyclic nucleotide-binding domain-containing protein [Gemmataceae bacterium]|nr:cyclic nucleotide-binding domain-containing protein [Gemmataceae bacterium]